MKHWQDKLELARPNALIPSIRREQMRQFPIVAFILALTLSSGASAHHKPGHHMPPGQAKKHATTMARPSAVAVTPPTRAKWAPYVDDRYGLSVELPFGMFDAVERNPRGIRLRAPKFGAVIDVYASEDAHGFNPQQFVDTIERVDRVREITYRAGGKNWFSLSGLYSKNEAGDPVIFYTKFMFSADRTRLAAFEISFPSSEKPRFADAVERIEDTFSGPGR